MNRHFILFALAFAAALSGVAKTFDVDISTGRPAASNEAYYHGETIEFRAVRGKSVVTNVEYSCVRYQTNGMDRLWWRTDGLVFHPTNDVGAASYRFFLEGRDDLGRDWHANGLLRLLPSPGFTPNTIELPVARLDFAAVEVFNAPYYTKAETEAKIVELAPAPDYSTNNAELVETIEATAPAPGDYANVSNKAMSAMEVLETGYSKWTLYVGHNVYNGWYQFYFDSAKGYWIVRMGDSDDPTVHELSSSTDPYATTLSWAKTSGGLLIMYRATRYQIPRMQDLPTATSELENDGDGDSPFVTTEELEMATNELTNYTDSATNALAQSSAAAFMPASFTETDPTIKSWAKADTKPTYTAEEVGATTAADVYRLVAGTNVVLVVTNYNSATHAAAMKLQHLDNESGQYVTYWDEMRQHEITYTKGTNYTDAAIAERAAPRAWSGTTSGLGSEAPAGVTWISTPETVIAGGFEYEKVVTSAGAVWVLTSNGMSTGATSNSFFRVAASDGTELFSIEKTDSYLIGVNADGITRSGNTVTIPIDVVAAEHPYIRATTNLVNAVWVKEDENGFSCPWATVSWSGTTGAYVATVTTAEPQAFFYFEYMVEGQVKIKNSAKTEMSGGILFNGTTYLPTVNGNKLEFVAQ